MQFKQSHDFNLRQTATTFRLTRPTLDIRHQTYTCDLDLYPMSSRQLFRYSPTSPGAIQLGLSIFLFHFLSGSTGGIILTLLIKAIGLAAIILEVIQTSHCLAPWSHLEMWWGVWVKKSLTLDIISALVKTDRLDTWLPQKQPDFELLVTFSEKLYCFALPIAPKTERYRGWNRIITSQQ